MKALPTDNPAKSEHFATLSGDALSAAVLWRFREYHRYLRDSGLVWLIYRSVSMYYGVDPTQPFSRGLVYFGPRGEYTRVSFNHLRDVVRHRQNLAVPDKWALEAEASSQDYEAGVQVRKAGALLEHLLWREGWAKAADEAVERSTVQSFAAIRAVWDVYRGEPLGEGAWAGGYTFDVHGPLDVAFDPYMRHHRDPAWYVCREWVNKYELAARFPERYEDIQSAQPWFEIDEELWGVHPLLPMDLRFARENDVIPVWHLYHKSTPAVPGGRYALVLDTGEPLLQGPLPYRQLPVQVLGEAALMDTPFFYCTAWELLAPQQYHNMLSTITATNARAGGVPVFVVPQGSNLSAEQMGQGLALLQVPAGMGSEAKVLHAAATQPEVYANLDRTEAQLEKLGQINSVVRGGVPTSDSSGSLAALVQATALQAAAPYQRVIYGWMSDTALHCIQMAEDYLTWPVKVEAYGEFNSLFVEEVSGQDVARVTRVVVKQGNPMARTLAGRYSIANALKEMGAITPEQYLHFIQYGQIERVTAPSERELALVQLENQQMLRGELPPVLETDTDAMHVQQHQVLFSSPMVRNNQQLAAIAEQHILWHVENATAKTLQNPMLLELLGQRPLESAIAMAAPPMASAGAPAPQGGGGGGPPAEVAALSPGAPADGGAPPNLPSLPENPATGQQWDPATGGGMAPTTA